MLHLVYFNQSNGNDVSQHTAKFITALINQATQQPIKYEILDELFLLLCDTAEAKDFIDYLLKDLIRQADIEITLDLAKYDPYKINEESKVAE